MLNLWTVALTILFMNLPFGFWRGGTKKFSLPWFLAIHIPVPFVVCLRILSGLELSLATVPVFLTAYFTGQFLGGKLRSQLK